MFVSTAATMPQAIATAIACSKKLLSIIVLKAGLNVKQRDHPGSGLLLLLMERSSQYQRMFAQADN